jgi:hypothetical protein
MSKQTAFTRYLNDILKGRVKEMKNIHILPTQNEITSKLFKVSNELKLTRKYDFYNGAKYQNIYITSDEEIKEEDWVITPTNDIIQWAKVFQPIGKKIILTTDAYLIKDDVQAVDDEFLEWFVKNPSFEFVEVKKGFADGSAYGYDFLSYRIIFPKEEQYFLQVIEEIEKLKNETK